MRRASLRTPSTGSRPSRRFRRGTRVHFPTLARMAKMEERQELWGGETTKAVANFPVSGEPIPAPVVHWLGRIKGAAARVNAELGLLDADKAERISAAASSDRRAANSTTSSRSTSSRPAPAPRRT